MLSFTRIIDYFLQLAVKYNIYIAVNYLLLITIKFNLQINLVAYLEYCYKHEYVNIIGLYYDYNIKFDYLRAAIRYNNVDILNFLLENKINITDADNILLLYCVRKQDNINLLKSLIKHGINVFKYYYDIINTCCDNNFEASFMFLVKYSYDDLCNNKH